MLSRLFCASWGLYIALLLYKDEMVAYLYGAERKMLVSNPACLYVCSILCSAEGLPLVSVSVLSADIGSITSTVKQVGSQDNLTAPGLIPTFAAVLKVVHWLSLGYQIMRS